MKKLLSVLLGLVMLVSFTAPVVMASQADNTLNICVGPNPDTIDPALNSSVDGATMIIHGFEGLMTLDKEGMPIFGQAASVAISDDGLTVTFTLKDDLKWSDGKPLTAADFIYSWNRAIDPDLAADYEYMFDVVKGYDEGKLDISAPDDKTVVVNLTAAVPYFLELCAFPAYFPVREDIVTQYGDAWATEPATYVGNGPYKIVEWVPSSYVLYQKNENYWDYANLGTEYIKFVLMDDDNAILNAYKAGELSFIDSVPQDEMDALKAEPDFYIKGQIGTYYISFNTQKAPLDNPLVRKALSLAIDRVYICEKIGKSGQQPAGGFVPTGLTDADPANEFRVFGGNYYDPADYEGNLVKAKQALADAGYPDGEGFPTLEYIHNVSTGHQAIAEALQDMWKKLGINVTLSSQDWATFLNTRKNGEYMIARNGWLGDYNDPISFLDMWVTGGGNNDAQWSNAEYDALIKKVKTSSDRAERMSAMHEAEDIIFSVDMLAPIYFYVDAFMIRDNVKNFWSSPLGFKYFMYATVE